MNRPNYLQKYFFDWETLDVVISGRSALDTNHFLGPISTQEDVDNFLKGYGLDYHDPVGRAELFGNFQEAIQFIKRYFLIEGGPEGLDLKIPNTIFMITDIGDLFLKAIRKKGESQDQEERLWAEIILKVMHTILHVDKDLRSNYFKVIQTQIFDRFYKYVFRDEDEKLRLGIKGSDNTIELLDFETKSKKSRESVIIKLLHKAENVAEELFDRIGIRFVTNSKFDSLRVVKFLIENSIVIPHNVKPSRSLNSLIDLGQFRKQHHLLIKKALRESLSEEQFLENLDRVAEDCLISDSSKDGNVHTSTSYRSLQFTCRQLITYKNPFVQEFNNLRKEAKDLSEEENPLVKKITNLDISLISRDIKFFYPFEVQVLDQKAHEENTEGEASHTDYKKSQINYAKERLFKDLLEFLSNK